MGKTSSWEVGTFNRLFLAEERRYALKGKHAKPLGYFFLVHWSSDIFSDVPATGFYDHAIV